MTVMLKALLLLILYFVVPFLVGNIYSAIFSKNKLGVADLYLSGMAIVYAGLFVLQLSIVKFKFDLGLIVKIYTIYFGVLLVLGALSFGWKLLRKNYKICELAMTKKTIWLWGLVLLQGVLYIVVKNPYFENNALLETTKVTLETGTLYQYNGYSGLPAVAGFPLANKLMFLPGLYSYICLVFGINPVILFNFIVPCVTFLSFYLVMLLWVRRLGKEYGIKWEKLFLILFVVIQLADGWIYSTGFRVLHEGYTGEAIFFGVLFLYALLRIKNRRYLICLASVCAFPGLVKYSLVTDFFKGITGFFRQAATYNGIHLLFVIAVVIYIIQNKKASAHLLNVNLTIALCGCQIWEKVVEKESNKRKRIVNIVVLCCFLLLCGNTRFVSDATCLRSNLYGISKNEYEVLEKIADDNLGEKVRVVACNDVNKWICRSDFNIEPVVGYDISGGNAGWYSYETYGDKLFELWKCVQFTTEGVGEKLMLFKEDIEFDYVVIKRVTEYLPIRDNEKIKCVFESPYYLVYSVDK